MLQTLFSLRRRAAGPLLLLPLAPLATSQVSHGGQPAAHWAKFDTAAPLVIVDAPDVDAYMLEDEALGYRPLRYGALLDLDLDLSDGAWTELPDGSRAWRLRIRSEGAKSLAVEFDLLDLPPGAELFVYGPTGTRFLGAYTTENEHLDGTFVFEPFAGEEIVLEIDVPEGVEDPVLDTASLIYDYRDVFGLMDGTVHVGPTPIDPGNCLIDVNCPQGDAWEFQKRATMRTLSGGGLCSGALVNNTAQDGTNYVLTANHCGQTSNTVFRFNYQRANCGSGGAPTSMSVSGCTVLTSNSTYDNRLLRINTTIPESYEPYYAGWSRSTANSSFAFSMGHPSGGPKKISIDQNGAIRESRFWRVSWSEGTLEGGSSGGPLFDQNGRVVGPACCVSAFNCNQTAWYGRLDQFWSSNPIAQYLDPLGSNPTLLDGLDPANACEAPENFCTFLPNSVGPGAQITYTGSNFISANDLVLECSGLPPNVAGIFFYGNNETGTLFGEGILCVSGDIKRLGVQFTDILGTVQRPLDFTQPPFDAGSGAAIAGETKRFQFWHRDVMGGPSGFNTSDGLAVTFCD